MSEVLGSCEAGLVMVRGGAIFAVPDAPVRVLGSGRRGGGREPMASRGDCVLTLDCGVGEVVPPLLLVPEKRMEPMVSVAATRRVWMVMGVPSSANETCSVYWVLEDGVARFGPAEAAGGGEGVA